MNNPANANVPIWRKRNLPRLDPAFYKAFAFVFWTHTMENRATGWLSHSFHGQFRELLLHTCARHDLMCPVYCLMPNHIHLMCLGIGKSSDQLQATRFLRKHLATLLHPAGLQRQPYDHVLREEERERGAFQGTCHYIQENPVRKDLAKDWFTYPYTGCMIPGYPELDVRAEDFWQRFWRVYQYVRKIHALASVATTNPPHGIHALANVATT